MEFQDNNSSIDKLKEVFIQETAVRRLEEKPPFENEFYDAASDWSHEDEESPEKKPVFTISRE